MTPSSRYLVTWSAALLAILLLVGGLNAIVNPYDVFASPRLLGINQLKPGIRNHTALSKTYQIERAHLVTVVLGASRTYIGIDSASPEWPEAMRPVYNYGIPGYVVAAALARNLRQAWATGHLRHAVVFLDYTGFLSPDKPPDQREDERRMLLLDNGTSNPDRSVQYLHDAFFSVFTMGALLDSVTTLLSQRGADRVFDVRSDGTASDADFANATRVEGMNALFAQKNLPDLDRVIDFRQALADWQGPMPNLNAVRDMIRFCLEHDVKLTLILGAAHADAMEIYRRAGLWPRIEQLKVDLAALATEANSETVVVWDFLEYGPYTTEPVAPPGDLTTRPRWFWEATHFRKALGEVMLRRVFSGQPDDFGARLTPATVEARNRHVREQQNPFVGWRLACQATSPPRCVMPSDWLAGEGSMAEAGASSAISGLRAVGMSPGK